MRQLLERFRLRRFPAAAVGTAVVLVGSYPLLFIAAVLPDGHDDRLPGSWLFVAAAVAGYAAEVIAPRVATYLVNLLNWVQVGTAVRFVFREAALIVLLARVLNADAVQFAAFTLGLMALHGLRAVYSALAIYVNQRRRLPVVTRNVDLSELRISDPPPRLLTVNHSWKMLFLDVPAVMGGLIADITDDFTWSLAGISLAIVTGVAACAGIAPYARRNRHLGDKARVLRVVNDRIREHAPQVVLYFSGARDAAYQANMWLETLARLDRPAMIIMRERWLVPLLGRTGLPVVCIDGTVDLMNFPVPSARVALYPANTGKNLHMIRIRGVAHVFVGHGDSDKAASSNPFARVYNQVWVAGQAGRDRYLRAGVGVRDDDVVRCEEVIRLFPAARLAECEQHFAVRTELEDLVPFSVLGAFGRRQTRRVGHPQVRGWPEVRARALPAHSSSIAVAAFRSRASCRRQQAHQCVRRASWSSCASPCASVNEAIG